MSSPCILRAEIEHWAQQGCHVGCAEEYTQHAEGCPSCASFIEQIQSSRTLFAQLPERDLPVERRTRVRNGLIAEASGLQQKQGRRDPHARLLQPQWALAAGFAIIAAAAAFTSFKKSSTFLASAIPRSAAEVTLVDSAIGHTIQPGANEVYELVQGLAEFNVKHLDANQRFRVLVGDDQVEVRGTRFQVMARQHHLESVKVLEGRVQVTRLGRGLTLDAGQNWLAELPVETSQPPSVAVPPDSERADSWDASPSASRVVARPGGSASTSKTNPSNPELFDVAFSAALTRLRSGDAAGAVVDFDMLLNTSAVDAGRKSDVLYWLAIANHRSGNDRIAEQRLRQLLAAQSNGWHAPDAALLLGEILVARGAPQSAKPWLERAAQSNRPSTSSKAKQLLERLGSK